MNETISQRSLLSFNLHSDKYYDTHPIPRLCGYGKCTCNTLIKHPSVNKKTNKYQKFVHGHNDPGGRFKPGKQHPYFGKHRPKEVKDKISKSHIGIKQTEESIRKISKNRTGKCVGKDNSNYGKCGILSFITVEKDQKKPVKT